MPAGRLIIRNIPAIDADGNTVAGAELRWFEAGTTTPKPVYSDVGLTTPHTYPITSDINGQFPQMWGELSTVDTPNRYRATIYAPSGIMLPGGSLDDVEPSLSVLQIPGLTSGELGITVTALGESILAETTALGVRDQIEAMSRDGSDVDMTAGEAETFRNAIGAQNYDYETIADAEAATIPAVVEIVRIARHSAGKPFWPALYERFAGPVTEAWEFEDAIGGFWTLSTGQDLALPMFGWTGDGVANDTSAWQAMYDYGYANNGIECIFPRGFSLITSTLTANVTTRVIGRGNHFKPTNSSVGGYNLNNLGSVVIAAAGITAFEFLPADPATPGVYTGLNTIGSSLENMSIRCKSNGAGGGNFDGINARNAIIVRNVSVRGFERDGIHIEANEAAGSPTGNANSWYLDRVYSIANGRDGLYVDGADTNAGCAVLLNCTSNGRDGIHDDSLIGNTYIAYHAASNANLDIWTADTAPTCFYGPYIEGGGAIHIGDATTLIGQTGGQLDPDATSDGFVMNVGVARAAAYKYTNDLGSERYGSWLGYNDTTLTVRAFGLESESATHDAWREQYISGRVTMKYAGSVIVYEYPVTADRAQVMWFKNGIGIGTAAAGKHITFDSAAPVTGTHARGDNTLYTAPSAAGKIGAVCTAAGTPGTHKEWGAIDP